MSRYKSYADAFNSMMEAHMRIALLDRVSVAVLRDRYGISRASAYRLVDAWTAARQVPSLEHAKGLGPLVIKFRIALADHISPKVLVDALGISKGWAYALSNAWHAARGLPQPQRQPQLTRCRNAMGRFSKREQGATCE